jgi:hypothetical protein
MGMKGLDKRMANKTATTKKRRRPRLQSNDEVLLHSMRTKGQVKIRLVFQILDTEKQQYVGFCGKSLVFRVKSPGVANQAVDAAERLFLEWRPE